VAEEISFRGATVHRVPWPMRGTWRMRRYYHQLGLHLDASLASTGQATSLMVGFDCSADLGALRRAADKRGARFIAVVNRELHPQFAAATLSRSWIRRLNLADEIVTCCPAVHVWMVGQGAINTPLTLLPTVIFNEVEMIASLDRDAVRKSLGRLHLC
jgi:hypothetical protein